MDSWTAFEIDEYCDAFPRIEEEFQGAHDESLAPRGPDLLFALVESFERPAGASHYL